MATDYDAIRVENKGKYGTDIGRYGPMLLADRYDNRTHFIFELLQNAEDALARRSDWQGSREIRFKLTANALHVSHRGRPFSEGDVRNICGIAESTKNLTFIGRFGIGFKSVYAFTDRPEVHSGPEAFAIENFVWPAAIPAVARHADETLFILPLRKNDIHAVEEISDGLKLLGSRALLFLRQIDEISWSVEGGPSGVYMRSRPAVFGNNGRKVTLIGEKIDEQQTIEEEWLVFPHAVSAPDGTPAGHVEIAFALHKESDAGALSVLPLPDSPLVVYFPTVLPTRLGFLVQGPYRTTPSRDNVPKNDPWNQFLVQHTATLLVNTLRTLRDTGYLTAQALNCLPLDRAQFPEGSMFAPLFDAVAKALSEEPLLPCFGGGYSPAGRTRLARTQEMRELLGPAQLAALLKSDVEIAWLSETITQDRTPELRRYLVNELHVAEIVPEVILSSLSKSFLEEQSDDWIVRLYEFIQGQAALRRQQRFPLVPLVRLESGKHVPPFASGQVQAFLPGPQPTEFPTARAAICAHPEALKFLMQLGLTQPDLVDDVVRNVLPRYTLPALHPYLHAGIQAKQYQSDVERILRAFRTDSESQRKKLIAALRTSHFPARDTGSGYRCFAQPADIYLVTQRLRKLFDGVHGIIMLDDSYECLHGEDVRELLEACGATRYLALTQTENMFSPEELSTMRTRAGTSSMTDAGRVEDYTLRGLDPLLEMLPMLDAERSSHKARLLWEALGDVEDRHGKNAFSGTYHWFYVQRRSCQFDAQFVRRLNETAWVPDARGELQPPSRVLFEETGWNNDSFLLSKILFKLPAIAALAKEVGIDPAVFDLLKQHGLTSVSELKARLRIHNKAPTAGEREIKNDGERHPASTAAPGGGGGTARQGSEQKTTADSSGSDPTRRSGTPTADSSGSAPQGGTPSSTTDREPRQRSMPSGTRYQFVSYVAVRPDEEEKDSDELAHDERIALEESAIVFILSREPLLQRTPPNNPGFDLFEPDADGVPVRWIEVKAMTGDFSSRPVGLSATQFQCAQQHGEAYWLYVVESASDPERACLVRIKDPAGKAKTFTFDQGWRDIAES